MFNLDRDRPDVTAKSAGETREEIQYIIAMLEDAIYTLPDRPHRAGWRLADAGGRLRRVLENPAYRDELARLYAKPDGTPGYAEGLAGVDFPSGLGCVLPTIPRIPRLEAAPDAPVD